MGRSGLYFVYSLMRKNIKDFLMGFCVVSQLDFGKQINVQPLNLTTTLHRFKIVSFKFFSDQPRVLYYYQIQPSKVQKHLQSSLHFSNPTTSLNAAQYKYIAELKALIIQNLKCQSFQAKKSKIFLVIFNLKSQHFRFSFQIFS